MTTKIPIGQAKAVIMPKGLQWFGLQQAMEYLPAEKADLEQEAAEVRKEVYGDPPFGAPTVLRVRIPHFTAPRDGLTGGKRRVGEVALAHGGLLVLSPIEEFSRINLEDIAAVWKKGTDNNGRPARFAVLIGVQPETLTLPTGRARVEKALALFGATLEEQRGGTMATLIAERADAYMRHCVAGVTKSGKDKGAAFAICKAAGNRAGYYQPGTKVKTAKGTKAIRAHARDKAAPGKDAAYDRAVKSEGVMSMKRLIEGIERALRTESAQSMKYDFDSATQLKWFVKAVEKEGFSVEWDAVKKTAKVTIDTGSAGALDTLSMLYDMAARKK